MGATTTTTITTVTHNGITIWMVIITQSKGLEMESMHSVSSVFHHTQGLRIG